MPASASGRPREEDSPAPGLFVILPAEAVSAETAACAAAFLAGVQVASLLLPELEKMGNMALAEELVALAREMNVVALARAVQDCHALNADGVHVETDDPARIGQVRRALGEGLIVGACCPVRRHAAMEMGEAGADYLGIDQRVEAGGENLLAWWAEMFVLPVVAMHPVGPEEVMRLARMGADFVVPRAEIWAGPEQATRLAAAWAGALAKVEQTMKGTGGS